MSAKLHAGLRAGLQRGILGTRLLRATSAGVFALFAVLAWTGARPPASGGLAVGESTAVAGGTLAELAQAPDLDRLPTIRTTAQLGRVALRHHFLARARAAEGDGDATHPYALASSPAPAFGDDAGSARVHLRRLESSHAPYGEPSPFDATAPPVARRRNG